MVAKFIFRFNKIASTTKAHVNNIFLNASLYPLQTNLYALDFTNIIFGDATSLLEASTIVIYLTTIKGSLFNFYLEYHLISILSIILVSNNSISLITIINHFNYFINRWRFFLSNSYNRSFIFQNMDGFTPALNIS